MRMKRRFRWRIRNLEDLRVVYWRTVWATLGLGSERMVRLITKRLVDRDDIRQATCEVLIAIGPAAVEPLIARLGDDKSDVRQGVCEALGQLGDLRAVVPLIARLGDYEVDVRQAAHRALDQLGEGQMARAVLGVLAGEEIARAELFRLAASGDIRAMEPLIAQWRGADDRVRYAVHQALVPITKLLKPHLDQLLCRTCLARFELRIYTGTRH
jgi:HEAT repeat protein